MSVESLVLRRAAARCIAWCRCGLLTPSFPALQIFFKPTAQVQDEDPAQTSFAPIARGDAGLGAADAQSGVAHDRTMAATRDMVAGRAGPSETQVACLVFVHQIASWPLCIRYKQHCSSAVVALCMHAGPKHIVFAASHRSHSMQGRTRSTASRLQWRDGCAPGSCDWWLVHHELCVIDRDCHPFKCSFKCCPCGRVLSFSDR